MASRVPTVIAVEGTSDEAALRIVARRLHVDLDGISIVPIGGAHAIRRFADGLGSDVRVRGLCDEREAQLFRDVLDDVHVCVPDLEGELIRALGVERALELVDDSFATLQRQPAQRGRPVEAQLHRWLRSINERSKRYLPLFVEAVDVERLPAPLVGVLS